jgi:SAM-dependent methyltransferase
VSCRVWLDPDLYDIENYEDPPFDLAFWEAVVREAAPRRMLELAAGTGRLTLPLAQLGVAEEIVALDSSAPFLERLRSRVAGESLPTAVTVVNGLMQSPAVDGPFDLVIVPFNSLAYLIAPEDRMACFGAASALLAPGGRFAFDLIQPRYDLIAEAMHRVPPLRVDIDHVAPGPGVSRLLRSYYDTFDAATQTLRSVNRYEIHRAGGSVDQRIIDLDWHIYFPEELRLLLSAAGLEPVERYGDYDRRSWTADSRRYLWVTEARGTRERELRA